MYVLVGDCSVPNLGFRSHSIVNTEGEGGFKSQNFEGKHEATLD